MFSLLITCLVLVIICDVFFGCWKNLLTNYNAASCWNCSREWNCWI